MTSVLLDFSNLRGGGALQVASNVLHELTQEQVVEGHDWLGNGTEIWISPAVARNVEEPGKLPGTVIVRETRPTVLAPLLRRPIRFDARFTLFGPTYTGRLARRELTGFAEVTMVYRPEEYRRPTRRSLRETVGNAVKDRMVHHSDAFVTETAAIAERMVRKYGIQRDRIAVVPNRPHHLFRTHPILHGPRPDRSSDELHVAYVTRAYPHKNLAIVGTAGNAFAQLTGRKLVVHVTLRAEEWERLPPDARRWMCNHGELKMQQVLDLYRGIDAIFFPSLLEASSSTPLEANVLGLPLIASDRDFVRASAQASEYFEPLDGQSAANALARFAGDQPSAWAWAATLAAEYRNELDASSRTRRYLDLLAKELELLS
jgi:glycosyltransferase involved in cell wall biosynthesis